MESAASIRPAVCDHREVYALAFAELAAEQRFVAQSPCPDCRTPVMENCSVAAALQSLKYRLEKAHRQLAAVRAITDRSILLREVKPLYETLTRDEYREQDHAHDVS